MAVIKEMQAQFDNVGEFTDWAEVNLPKIFGPYNGQLTRHYLRKIREFQAEMNMMQNTIMHLEAQE